MKMPKLCLAAYTITDYELRSFIIAVTACKAIPTYHFFRHSSHLRCKRLFRMSPAKLSTSTVKLMLTCAIAFGCREKGSKSSQGRLTTNSLFQSLSLLQSPRNAVNTERDDIRLYDMENNDDGVLEVSFYALLEEGRAVLPVDALEAAVLVGTLHVHQQCQD